MPSFPEDTLLKTLTPLSHNSCLTLLPSRVACSFPVDPCADGREGGLGPSGRGSALCAEIGLWLSCVWRISPVIWQTGPGTFSLHPGGPLQVPRWFGAAEGAWSGAQQARVQVQPAICQPPGLFWPHFLIAVRLMNSLALVLHQNFLRLQVWFCAETQ